MVLVFRFVASIHDAMLPRHGWTPLELWVL